MAGRVCLAAGHRRLVDDAKVQDGPVDQPPAYARPDCAPAGGLLSGLAKSTSRFVCQSCGAVAGKWAGRCEACGAWNTIVEEAVTPRPGTNRAGASGLVGRAVAFVGLTGEAAPPPRADTGIAELDRVLGGGLVAGSAVLVGGDPGIGKSTLLLQAAAALARAGRRVLYISGEESVDQVRLRARRLGVADAPIELAAAINLRDIAASLEARGRRRPGGDRFDPDHVAGHHRQRARHRRPGARLRRSS